MSGGPVGREDSLSYHHLEIDEPASGVVRCVMSNPPTHTLVAGELAEIDDFVAALGSRDDVRVVVFTGGGEGVFIRHYEVAELADASERRIAESRESSVSSPDADDGTSADGRALHRFNRVTLAMERAPYVTIAAMNGNAAGGGFEFALGCDFRLMADGDYRVGLPETGVGIIPGAGGTQRLARLLGTAKALELILHGTLLTPRDAHRLGVVTALLPQASFEDGVLAYARRLAGRLPIGIACAKAAIYRGIDGPLEQGLRLEQELFARCMASEDAAKAMRSVVRDPGRR